jgi:uncharacterized protein DUF3300
MNIFNKKINFYLMLLFALLSFSVFAQAANNEQNSQFSQAQLEQMLAPIALYPDSLLTHILIASTYPLEVIQAQRWLDNNANVDTSNIADDVKDKDWDASVKALMPFPRVIKRLNDDLTWTQNLGDAFLQNEQRVLASIQVLRQKADQAGNLAQMDNMDVTRENKTIIIQSAQPEIVYVPYYDSRSIYGDWAWYNYPPVYWQIGHNSSYSYRSLYSPFYWHNGIQISFNYFFNGFNWGNNHLLRVSNYSPHNRYSYSYGYQFNAHQTARWQHQPSHRRGVAYRGVHVQQRYHSNRVSASASRGHQLNNRQHNVSASFSRQSTGKLATHKVAYVSKHQQLTQQLRGDRAKALTHSTNRVKTHGNKLSSNQLAVNKLGHNSGAMKKSKVVARNENYQSKSYQKNNYQGSYRSKNTEKHTVNNKAEHNSGSERYAKSSHQQQKSSRNKSTATRSHTTNNRGKNSGTKQRH